MTKDRLLALDFRTFLSGLVVSLVVIIIEASLAMAFAALIFRGELSGYLSAGVGLMLFAVIALSSVAALQSSIPGVIVSVQDSPAIILSLISIAIVQNMPDFTDQAKFTTVVAAIIIASVITGVVFWLLGHFKLGNLIRYIPYPVIGGFLAGTGLLLFTGGISVMTGMPVNLLEPAGFLQPELVVRWGAGLIFAVVLVLATRRYSHFLIPPGVILGSILLFYLVLWITGTPSATAVEQGWLLGTAPEQGLWPPLDYSAITQINVPALVTQTGNLAVVVIVAVVGILLNITGIEIVTGQTIDLNRELKAAGLGNVISGLGGGGAGYHTLGSSTLAYKMGTRTRLVAVLMAIFALIILLLGGSFLSYFPNLVLGGLLIFLGLDFLAEWVYEAWFKLSKADYGIILLILVTMNTVGVLEGVGLGIFLAVILFVINYSRIDVVKHVFSGTTYHTRVDRDRLYQQLLHSKDHWLYILELQGFIFFGTANKLFEQIQQRLTASDSALPRFIILDFRRVSGLDSSAVFSFTKIKQLIRSKKVVLIFTDLSPDMAHQLKGVLDDGSIRQFSNLNYGLEWCENEMIHIYREVGLATKPKTLAQQLEAFWREQRQDEKEAETAVDLMDYLRPADPHPGSEKIIELMNYWQKMEVETGHHLTRQGDPAQTLYFIERGRATVEIEAEGGKKLPLRILEAGAVVGEVSIYRQQVASASVIATQPCTVYSLSLDDLKRIEKESPEAALILHKFLAALVSDRLAGLNNTLQAL